MKHKEIQEGLLAGWVLNGIHGFSDNTPAGLRKNERNFSRNASP